MSESTASPPEPYTVEEFLDLDSEQIPQLDRTRLEATSPYAVAQYLERLGVDDRRALLRILPLQLASDVLSETNIEDAADTVAAMREERALGLLRGLDPDDAVDVLGELEDPDRERLLGAMEPRSARTLEQLLDYDPETAGGLMTPEVDVARADLTVDDAIVAIRRISKKHQDLHYVYVVDEDRKLLGAVSLRKLIQARPETRLEAIMNRDLRGVVTPDTDREDVALLMAEYNLPDLAVVSEEGVLLGVITHDDVIDVLQSEATEDLQLMHGAGGDESVHDPLTYSLRRRGPWLLANLVTAFLAGTIVLAFEVQIGQLPLLAAFMPIIASVGGNTGHQALAVAIRSLALGEIQDSEGLRICLKELALGLLNGLVVGATAAGVAYLMTSQAMVALVVLMAMILNMGLAGITGAFIPLLLKRLRLDPAQSSSIFLTAATDIAGFFIFLSLGSALILG